MSKSAIVIGAGVIGSSVAWELAKNGYSVTVVDKESGAGQGSTSASSAVIRFNYSTFDSVALAWESYRGWQNWPAHLGIKLDHYAEVINAGVVMVEVPFMPFEPTEALFKAAGIPYEIWGAKELAEAIPGFDTGKYWPPKQITDDAFWDEANGNLTAMYTKDGGYVNDPLLAAQNLAAAAVANGAVMKFRTAVTGIIKNDERVLGVTLSDGSEL
ncbi:MAG: FAD-binding oxidoreductase, partial [Actinobacteria bacterium]|nr:FAD-binding oxidoreductase [Actinomycetota bacterium]